jgi:CheY-like chemotaxis protein
MPKTLLLADDSVTIQRVIELTFAHEDVRVVAVSDGRRAIQWLEGEWPDVVLADVDVPEVDGYQIAKHVKNSSRLKNVPVLLLAGAFEPVDEDRVRAVGCDGVLVKPFEPQQLVTRVKGLLARQPEAVLAGVGADGRGAGAELASVTPFPGVRGFDAVGDPEPLEPPTRPVWEIGLPERPAERPVHSAVPAAAVAAPAPEPVRAAAPQASKVSLVSAFSALLAAEHTAAPTPVASAAAAPVTEATVEDAVRRVLVRMTDDLVRRIVVETAERLIREEIEKIKANPE